MKRILPSFLQALLPLAAAAVILSSCVSAAGPLSPELTPGGIFQRAQDAAERGDYPLAMRYYQSFKEKYPNDVERGIWASYEIAFLYHKEGDDAKALALFDELLARYEKEGESLPEAPRILTLKLKARLQPKTPPAP